MFDVAVIGAGVSGAAVARGLSAFRLSVAVLEASADVSFGVSKANSGIVHAGFHHDPSTLKARLEVRGNALFDILQAELGFPFRRAGAIVAAFSYEEMKTVDSLYEQGLANGVPGLEIVGRERLRAMEPSLSPDAVGGLWAPSAGIVEPYRFVFALLENAKANGVSLLTDFRVTAAEYDGAAWRISAGGRSVETRWVVNAAGLFADAVSALFGAEDYRIIPRKGEEYILDRNASGLPHSVIFPVPSANSKGTLVIPTVEGTMMIGPTAEEVEDKGDTGTTPENLERIFRLAARMVPAVSKKDVITSFAGLRPTLPGDDFYIELSKKAPRFVQVAGIQSPGLTSSPAIAERVRDLLHGGGLELVPRDDFKPSIPRFPKVRELSPEELEKLAEKDPAFARIVCRCESVSEAEIVHAIRQGHTTLDGVKFYTRAGMGRCQGGFCAYRILSLISRETGMPLERITKRGEGSGIVTGRIGEASA